MPLRWDLFCRVVDNFGDIGVCWRLAADLAARGETVRLWTDDATALRWMAPRGTPGVTVGDFDAAGAPGEVVIEAFGCDPPAAFVDRMATRAATGAGAPLWINLEYLSAEPWVERSHGLPSPQPRGLTKWFWFPGFTPATGGLLREPGLLAARAAFARPPGPRRASVFCYDNPMLATLARRYDGELWLAPGPAQAEPALRQGPGARTLDWTDQAGYDRLLWSCDLNFVRGEDSLVRAIWAGVPFVWQLYPQHDGVHRAKLEAFLDRFLAGTEPGFGADLRALWRAWNGFGDWPARWPAEAPWRAACLAWRDRLAAQPDLGSRLQQRAHRAG
jgi:uncharacterized repeat protein (TIGR03837 family)